MDVKILIKYSEKLNRIIELSEICGEWNNHFNRIDWDNPNLLKWQQQSKHVTNKRNKLVEDFLADLYNDFKLNVEEIK